MYILLKQVAVYAYSKAKNFVAERDAVKRIERIAIEFGVTERGLISLAVTTKQFPDEAPYEIVSLDLGNYDNQLSAEELDEVLHQLDCLRDQVVSQGIPIGFSNCIWVGDNDTRYVMNGVRSNLIDPSGEVMECVAWLPGLPGSLQEAFMKRIRSEFPYLWHAQCRIRGLVS